MTLTAHKKKPIMFIIVSLECFYKNLVNFMLIL